MKGKLAFAEGQLFGRVAATLCRFLSKWASDTTERKRSLDLIEALEQVSGSLYRAGPKIDMPISFEPPFVLPTQLASPKEPL